jgi:hypothetical protein
MTTPTLDAPIRDLRSLRILFDGGASETHLVHKDQIATFVEAKTRLHHTPGVNPHVPNGPEPTRAVLIVASPFSVFGPVWWTTPSLMPDDVDDGASVYSADLDGMVVWVDQAYGDETGTDACTIDEAEAYWTQLGR